MADQQNLSSRPRPDDGPDSTNIRIEVERSKHVAVFGQVLGDVYIQQDFQLSDRDRSNRERLLDKVDLFWVKGVLEKSLYEQALIELGMEEMPEAVDLPSNWEMRAGHEPQFLPEGTTIDSVYESLGHELLILGAPGSGKTTILLELARTLIKRAHEDNNLRIPVVINLSSWAQKHDSLDKWLVEELNTQYQVPRRVGLAWVKEARFVLLLDGLDEMATGDRAMCVDAINAFREERVADIVVCSRVVEYEQLEHKLRLNGAILLQPLTNVQVDEYLQAIQLEGVRTLLKHDVHLRELTVTPLMVSIMTLAYRGTKRDQLQKFVTTEAHRKNLFASYIREMLRRKIYKESKPYFDKQTVLWLTWLATRMKERNQTVFLIEKMQPDLLLTDAEQKLYTKIVRLVFGVTHGLKDAVSWGLTFGLLGGTAVGLMVFLAEWLAVGLAWGLASGFAPLLVSFVIPNSPSLRQLVQMRGQDINTIELVETQGWSWANVRQSLTSKITSKVIGGLIFGGLFGLVFSLAWGSIWHLPGELVWSLTGGLALGLAGGLAWGLAGGLAWGLAGGLTGEAVTESIKSNQGIRSTAQNAIRMVIIGIVDAIIFITVLWLLALVVDDPRFDLLSLIWPLSLSFPIAAVLNSGGEVIIKHAILRWMLYRTGHIPLNYAYFLDYAVGRILLRKIGGGYIFIHRLLLEYFAEL